MYGLGLRVNQDKQEDKVTVENIAQCKRRVLHTEGHVNVDRIEYDCFKCNLEMLSGSSENVL